MRLSDQVTRQLYALVQEKQWQPGQRLPAERQLATQLGVSRTALREAIQRLASQGVLHSKVGSGTFVCEPATPWTQTALAPLTPLIRENPQYRYDVLETRQTLELSTAWFAAQRGTLEDMAHIRRCFDEMLHHQQSQDATQAARADAQFHLAIAEASHNVVLIQIMRSLFELVLGTVAQNRRLMFMHDNPQALAQLTQQHHDLMQAICAKEPQRAKDVIEQHLCYVHQRLAQADADTARRQRLDRFSTTTPSSTTTTP